MINSAAPTTFSPPPPPPPAPAPSSLLPGFHCCRSLVSGGAPVADASEVKHLSGGTYLRPVRGRLSEWGSAISDRHYNEISILEALWRLLSAAMFEGKKPHSLE